MLCSNFEQREAMMDLNHFSKADLIDILNIVKAGSSYEEALKSHVPTDVGNVISILHSLYCEEKHEGNEEDMYCHFLIEELWTDLSHTRWLALFNGVIDKCECSVTNIIDIVGYLVKIENIKEEVLKKEGEKGLLILNTLLQLPNI
jgi:hypothetical protein